MESSSQTLEALHAEEITQFFHDTNKQKENLRLLHAKKLKELQKKQKKEKKLGVFKPLHPSNPREIEEGNQVCDYSSAFFQESFKKINRRL